MNRQRKREVVSVVQRPVEHLERRQLLSTSVALQGTSGNDAFAVSYNPSTMEYSFSGGTTSPPPVAASDFAGFSVIGGGGNDTLTINGGTPTLLNNIGTDGTSFSVTVSTGTLDLATAEDLAAISIPSGAAVHMLGTGNALATSALVFAGTTNAWQGQLDLGSNNLIVHGGDLPTLTNQLVSGYNGGGWNGLSGIISSSAATDTTHLTTLGIASNNEGSGNPIYATFSDEFVAATDILVNTRTMEMPISTAKWTPAITARSTMATSLKAPAGPMATSITMARSMVRITR